MTNMKIIFVLMVTILNSINSLPTLDYSNGASLTGLPQELINILKNSRLNSLSSLAPNFSEANPSSGTPPSSSSTFNTYTNDEPTSQLPTSPESPPSFNPTELNSGFLSTPSTTPASDSAAIPPTASNKASNLDTLLNYSRNNHNSLISSLLQKSAPNPDTTQLLQSLLRNSITADTLPTEKLPTVDSPLDPSTATLPNLSQYPKPSPKLLSIEPISLSQKANEEILKLLSSSPATPLQEPNKNSEPNPQSLSDLPYKDSTVSQPPPPPPPATPSPSALPPSSDTLSAKNVLQTLISSPEVAKELTSILQKAISVQNSDPNPSLTAANEQSPSI